MLFVLYHSKAEEVSYSTLVVNLQAALYKHLCAAILFARLGGTVHFLTVAKKNLEKLNTLTRCFLSIVGIARLHLSVNKLEVQCVA